MIDIIKIKDKYKVQLIAIKMGKDWNVSIFGGDKPHIGAVAMGVPRQSLSNDNKISASVSVLTVTGHKEDEVIVPITKKITSKANSIVAVSCGIHIDNIKNNQIKIIVDLINEAVDEFIKIYLN